MSHVVDLAVRPSIVLVIGFVLDACLRQRSAALRHCVLAAAVLAAALVVPFSLALPAWEVSLPVPLPGALPAAEPPAAVAVARPSASPATATAPLAS